MHIQLQLPEDLQHLSELAPHIEALLKSQEPNESLQLQFGDEATLVLRAGETAADIIDRYREILSHDAIDMRVTGSTDFFAVAGRAIEVANEMSRRVHLQLNSISLEVLPDSTPIELKEQLFEKLEVRELPRGSLHAGDLFMGAGQGRAKDLAFSAVTIHQLTGKPVHYRFIGVELCAKAGSTPEALEHEYCRKAR
jgi:hypothetical protein